MTAPSPYAAVPPAGATPARATTAVLPVTIGIGAAALILAIVNAVFGSMFPDNAPVEDIYNFGVTVDLVAVAVVALVRVLILRRLPRAGSNRLVSVFGIVAAILSVPALAGWLVVGGAEYWTGGLSRYMSGSAGGFYLGVFWVLAVVFGELAFRRNDTTVNRVLSLGSIAVGSIVAVTSVAAAVVYGLGLSA
jgi:hypothetical protein